MEFFVFDLQLFAVDSMINATASYVANGVPGAMPDSDGKTLSPTMKTYYDTELLENARSNLVFAQFGKKVPLPANKGRTVEWRKWDTLPNATSLVEGVVPSGQKLGMSTLTESLAQYGMFVAITDLLDLHAIDNVLLGATEELGASAGETEDILIRNKLMTNTNLLYCDTVTNGTATAVTAWTGMAATNNRLTPDMINQAVTIMKKNKVPTIGGKYVCVIHPYCAYDLRASEEWIEAHKYAATTEIFNGEIGELHGVRFVETTNAPITTRTVASSATTAVFSSFMFGKDGYGLIDPAGGGLEMIVKDKSEVGGPLEQYSTAGYKFEQACKVLYPERVLRIESCSKYSATAEANYTANTANDSGNDAILVD